jgi:presenilin-like A22 family membrane protease
MRKEVPPVLAMAGILALTQLAAIAITPLYLANTQPVFENPNDPVNALIYLVLILAFTGVILFIVRRRRANVMKFVILFSMFFTMLFVIYIPFFVLFQGFGSPLADPLAFLEAVVLAAALTYALAKHPEWYLVDAVGILVAMGVIALLGMSFAILPAVLLLVALAIYDAISVYKTKHMVVLADAVASQRLPILIVVPKHRRYSFLSQMSLQKQISSGEEREAMFMGLGDIIIPGILVVSAFVSLLGRRVAVGGVAGNQIVALATVLGTLVGFALLMRFVLKGNPQAGLPLLNSGALAGYAIAYLLVYGELSFGVSFG